MKYLCLGYHDEKAWEAVGEGDRKALSQECVAYDAALRKNGQYVHGRTLQHSRTAATLRFEDGKVSLSAGPVAQTKEQLSDFLVIDARDLNHAIQLMSQRPGLLLSRLLEIRPIHEEFST